MLESPSLAAALGRRGHELVRHRSWSRVVEGLVAHYKEAIASRALRRSEAETPAA
ncbi:MAG: hypothetical protein HOP99_05935 [Dermatophilaceae bacterium]|nr:hypothetical protein [Dermatophilaceae bacterium]